MNEPLIAKAVPGTAGVKPAHAHDCDCRFLGVLERGGDLIDLYACDKAAGYGVRTEFVARRGSEPSDGGSLGDLAPLGTPYSLAAALNRRAKARGPAFRPRAWRVEGDAL